MSLWTTLRTWVVGETVTASFMNAQVRDNLSLAVLTKCRAIHTSAGTLPLSTTTYFAFQSVKNDALGMWNVGNPTRITVPSAGQYKVRCRMNGTASGSYQIVIRKNGTTAVLNASNNPITGEIGDWIVTLAATDYLEVGAVVGTGTFTFVDMSQVTGVQAEFTVEWWAP